MILKSNTIVTLKHELLLVSLLILLFGELLIPSSYQLIAQPILLIQTIFAGIILFNEKKNYQIVFIMLIFLIAGSTFYSLYYKSTQADSISKAISIFFFLSVSVEVYRQIYTTKEVKTAMIAAVFSGFILLCFIATFFFSIIENQVPDSFSNLDIGESKLQNLTYFSFITTLTIGYGDIVPLTLHAKKATMFVALLGNFYSVFVTGIIIGKYLNQKK